MIQAYLKYKSLGLECLPITKDKLPAIPKGESWLTGWNNKSEYELSYGIGIVCGNISGNLECIDIDNHFGDAQNVITDLINIDEIKDIYTKYKIPIQKTMNGGYHIIYRCTKIEGNQKLASRPRYDADIKKYKKDILIETRGEGGYFCVDPTPDYKVIKNSLDRIPNISPNDRDILLSACRSFNTYAEPKKHEVEEKDRPGDRFNSNPDSLYEMINALKDSGWTELKDGQWARPGKKKGISATLGKVAPGIFYNFSTSSDPFEDNKAYTAFQVISLLKYNGNYSRFAKELAGKYGTIPKTNNKEIKTANEIDDIIRKAFIDISIPVTKPPIIMSLKTLCGSDNVFTRIFTLGNFSAIIGKSKAKKSYLAMLLMAAAARGGINNRIRADLPAGRPGVVFFDTEQSNYDSYLLASRVSDLIGKNKDLFGSFDLREYSPIERCNIINRFIEKRSYAISFIVIDGIADLATAINDEIEASRIVSLLLKWTKLYNVHICTIIHQNKNDNYATGHLGSAIMKKAEVVISVTKDISDNRKSEISCDYIRGAMEFDKFVITIDDNGIPFIDEYFKANDELSFLNK